MSSTNNEKKIAQAKRLDRLAAEQDNDDLRWLMAQPAGRRFMRRLIVDTCGIHRSSYLGGPTGKGSDPTFLEGQRNVGLFYLSELNTLCPKQWLLANAEALEKQQQTEEITNG